MWFEEPQKPFCGLSQKEGRDPFCGCSMIPYLFRLAIQHRGEAKSKSLHISHLQHKYDSVLWAESRVLLEGCYAEVL